MPNTMHSFEASKSSIPPFLIKLWKLIEDSSCNDLISWSDEGDSFVIHDQTRFSKDLLPQYFKHNNMASFIRQLNMYGFRKRINYEKSGLRNENNEMEFEHNLFHKDHGGLLELIKRKMPNTKVTGQAVRSNARDILTDLTSIREKQENMDNMLLKMKQENELLWRELTSMRQKHKAQEQIIQKVIQFLVSIVQRGNQNIGVQRMPHMLHDSSRNKENKVTRTINVLRSKSPNYITVPQDKLVSPLGPVIHEVTDFDHEQEENAQSPEVNSPSEGTVPESDYQDSECPLNSSLNSPIDTSETMEPLDILEPLQQSTLDLNNEGESISESALGLPLDYINAPPSDVVTIPEVTSDNAIPLPESDTSMAYILSTPDMLVYSTSKSEFDDSLMSESLNTPKIPTIHIEDIYAMPATPNSKQKDTDNGQNEKEKNKIDAIQNEHSYQLALPNNSNSLKSSQSMTKNTFSNLVLNVEEKLGWIQERMNCGDWSLDENKLLGLFSSDDRANNETLADEIGAQSDIKAEVDDIVGKELVQFTPSMLECDFDMTPNHFLADFIEEVEGDCKILPDLEEQKNDLPLDVLNEANQEIASKADEYFLSNGSSAKLKSPRYAKIQKAKRRKLK